MVCSLEIIIPILGCITAIATLMTGISEGLPFIKKISGNGVIHSIYHLINKEKLNDCINTEETTD
tara:strand:+ start:305 stop:499 length:195 start_codon:yes stop_codon:yes gene_type:complete